MFQQSILTFVSFLFLFCAEGFGQNADCDQLLILQDTIYHTNAIAGFGLVKEFQNNALEDAKNFQKEENSIWYFIVAKEDAVLTFDILTENKADDWDFVLYAYMKFFCKNFGNKESEALRSNLSRSSITGLSQKGKENFVGAGVNTNYSKPITVTKGARYVLIVNNSKRAGGKHTLVLHYDSKQPVKIPNEQVEVEPKLEKIKSTPIALVTGFKLTAKDAISKEPVLAFITISGFNDGVVSVLKKSTYEKELIKKNHKIVIDISAKGYMLKSQAVNIGKNKSTFLMEVLLEKIEPGHKVNLKNIQFYGNRYDFLPKATSSLMALLSFMKENSNLVIEVGGHVNGPGKNASKAYKKLSYNRAYAVKEYLMENGIAKDRISAKGYANLQMLYPKPKSSGQESANRRVEIKILSNEYNSRN
jgi:outer membrane protein OmpA-like peptidoglycan-associated protein